MTDLENITLVIPSPIEPSALLGPQDEFLHLIEDSTAARISLHENSLRIQGNALEVQSLTTLFAGRRGKALFESHEGRRIGTASNEERCDSFLSRSGDSS